MSVARARTRDRVQVTIVSGNAETLDRLLVYLREAGLDARGTQQIDRAGAGKPAPRVVVFFPDDFHVDDVTREVARLRRERPRVLSVFVTREPQRFAEMLETEDGDPTTTVIAKPAWGWTILDAIRARLAAP